MNNIWQTSKRQFDYGKRTLVMGILNVTPDSFSDGGKFASMDAALSQAEKMIAEGVDIIDVGGESTRPNAEKVSAQVEIKRTAPIIEAIATRFDVALSIDTNKSEVASAAIDSGAEIINDISGLRFDEKIGEIASQTNAGLVLMHLRGNFETMHKLPPIENILQEVTNGLYWSVKKALAEGVKREAIALDIGIGFSKTLEQNLELIAKLNELCQEFKGFPMLVGTSRKSFIGKILGDIPTSERLPGSLASSVVAIVNGAKIVRVHDVKETVQATKIADAIKNLR